MGNLYDLKISLFKDLSDEDLSKISSISHSRDFPAGQLVIRQDDPSDYFYIILKGSVKVFRTASTGDEISVAQLKKGSFFGEMAILDGSPRSVSVRTEEDCTFMMISRENFLSEIEKKPHIAFKLLKGLSIRLRKTDESFISDIQRKNTELEIANRELRKLDEMKSKFFALASHELRTPLGVILMTLPLLESSGEIHHSDQGKSLLKIMDQQLLRLSDIIGSILKACESHDVLQEEKKLKENVNNIIRMACADLNHFFEIRNLKVMMELDPEIGEFNLYPGKIYQIVLNLLMNAIRFTPDGGEIKIGTKKQGSTVILTVFDSGVGIDKVHYEDIFKPFYVIESEMKHSSGTYQFMAGGLGLGLTIVKKFVELHNGTVEVKSEKEKGSSFSITLPIS